MAEVYPDANKRVAKMAGVRAEVKKTSSELLAAVQAQAATRHKTGQFSDSFKEGPAGGPDREVFTAHPAAVALELGHFAEKRDGTLGKWVPGQFNLVKAMKGMG